MSSYLPDISVPELILVLGIPFLLLFSGVLTYKSYFSPEQVAKRKYAKGEITFQQLREIRKSLRVTKKRL
ncbi:hypothetical protein H1S01_15520 [Heliobacterium chlorum]|uniref:SHOCT domain-containing protein n=1 Tax=Heliobacterium chlorum TaxID=2698 RepID=A0ABR7T534_HELCL|nr:hypothetical protein [Heliobacterium chlorum]MBC9785894.1 hypothetical protein [Heliobacterium chlorum]